MVKGTVLKRKELRPPCISHWISQQLRLSPAVKCLVLPLQSSYCFWHFRDIGQRACLFSLVLRKAKCSLQVCEKYQPWAHGAACTLERDISQSPDPKVASWQFVYQTAPSYPTACPHPPTHQPEASLPASSQLQDQQGLPQLSSCVPGGILWAPSVRQWPHFGFRGLLRHC